MSKKKDRKKVGKFIDLDAIEMQNRVDKRTKKFLKSLNKKLVKNPEVAALITPKEQNDDYPGFLKCKEESQLHLLSKLRIDEIVEYSTKMGYKLQIK